MRYTLPSVGALEHQEAEDQSPGEGGRHGSDSSALKSGGLGQRGYGQKHRNSKWPFLKL
jgi:hypothetical protein